MRGGSVSEYQAKLQQGDDHCGTSAAGRCCLPQSFVLILRYDDREMMLLLIELLLEAASGSAAALTYIVA